MSLLFGFGSNGSGDSEFDGAQGIFVNDTNIYIADTGNDRIQIFDLNGNFVKKFDIVGSGHGSSEPPVDVTALDNKIYVSTTNEVQIFELSERLVCTSD